MSIRACSLASSACCCALSLFLLENSIRAVAGCFSSCTIWCAWEYAIWQQKLNCPVQKFPDEHALRSCLALKLWSIERKSHAMSLVSDPGLALFAGLNTMPKKSFLSQYSSKV
jgi:hypothetical protein